MCLWAKMAAIGSRPIDSFIFETGGLLGFCPSCCGRRMSDVAAHLVTSVLPDQPVRQWVLSLAVWLRFVVLRRRELVAPVLGIVVRAISGWLMGSARAMGQSGQMQAGLVAVE